MIPRKFTVGQVMTVLVGDPERIFCSYGELLDVLGWLLQDVPMTDQMGSAIEFCRGSVRAQHPELVAYIAPPADAGDTHVLTWLADIADKHGNLLELNPLAEEVEP